MILDPHACPVCVFPDYWVYFKAAWYCSYQSAFAKFPDYWVYFKALLNWPSNASLMAFPDYWVYFKALSVPLCNAFFLHNFQTIESILKLTKMENTWFTIQHFQTIESILKHLFKCCSRCWHSYFQTIESILKRFSSPFSSHYRYTFPDYWVYFKAHLRFFILKMFLLYFQTIESILKLKVLCLINA